MYYGWRVVAGAFIAQFFVVGFFTYSITLLVGPVRETFGVSLEQVMYSMTAATLVGLVLQPLAGVMVDRYSVRWIMVGGGVVYGAGLLLLSQVQSILAYIVVFGITLSTANCFAGTVSASAVITRWFTASRGRALGITAIGTSVGGIAVPALISAWLTQGDWRLAVENYGLAILLVMVPGMALLVRGYPSDVGLEAEPAGDLQAPAGDSRVWQLGDIVRSGQFWLMGGCMGLLFAAYSAVLVNLTPYATLQNLSAEQGASLIMAVAIGGFAGKILFGVMADKLPLRSGLWIAQALIVIAFVGLYLTPEYQALLGICVVMGVATGGMLPVWGAIMASLFGVASYGRAMGLMGPVITLFIMPTYPLVGRLFDATGSYHSSLMVTASMVVVSGLLLIAVSLQQAQSTSQESAV
ncbi:MAG: MFS transporter [Halieaceae bacterium]|nr:MFS transporter [Halieaceae bacterium]